MADATLRETMRLCGLVGESWRPWETVAKCLDAEPLDRAERELFERSTQRTRPLTERPREVWVIKGRRCGGSRFAGAKGVRAARRRYDLAPGERAVIACAAADREQA